MEAGEKVSALKHTTGGLRVPFFGFAAPQPASRFHDHHAEGVTLLLYYYKKRANLQLVQRLSHTIFDHISAP